MKTISHSDYPITQYLSDTFLGNPMLGTVLVVTVLGIALFIYQEYL